MRKYHKCYLSIGSNLGDRRHNCLEAIRLIEAEGIKVVKRSSLYETKPWGLKDQPDFINMVVCAETSLSPEELLKKLKFIEKKMGRKESKRWGPRLIDIDILFYDDLVIDSPELKIPHPYIKEREFVLLPLSEIEPEFVHPVLKKTVRELYRELQRAKA